MLWKKYFERRQAPHPVGVFLVDANHRAAEEHPVRPVQCPAAEPPRADKDVVRAAEAVKKRAGPDEESHGRVHTSRVRQSSAPAHCVGFVDQSIAAVVSP